jgi:hypothetical protein
VAGGNVARMKRLLAQFICTLIVVAVLFHFIWWIVAAAGLFALAGVMLAAGFYMADRVDAKAARLAALRARADQQHRWALAGDDRGVYGAYPPAV